MDETLSRRMGALRPAGEALTYRAERFPKRVVDTQSVDEEVVRGRQLFFRDWLRASPEGPQLAGPDLDASSCATCHVETVALSSGIAPLVTRPVYAEDRVRYGDQLTAIHVSTGMVDTGTVGIGMADVGMAEATRHTLWIDREFVYPDGELRKLRQPKVTAALRDGERISGTVRVAPVLFGWGLLEQVPPSTLEFFHDPLDLDNDGISGRGAGVDGAPAIFGWKGTQQALRGQIVAALANDMGLTSAPTVRKGSHYDAEVSGSEIDALVRYVASLGAPDRRHKGSSDRGEMLFGQVGCAACHVPALITGVSQNSSLSDQLIWPYSDLALHDMGPELADTGDDPDAAEWRTSPLWGVGIVEERLPDRGFLHDGRARDLEEAVLWHGGEGEAARDRFASLPRPDRRALLVFLRSI